MRIIGGTNRTGVTKAKGARAKAARPKDARAKAKDVKAQAKDARAKAKANASQAKDARANLHKNWTVQLTLAIPKYSFFVDFPRFFLRCPWRKLKAIQTLAKIHVYVFLLKTSSAQDGGNL